MSRMPGNWHLKWCHVLLIEFWRRRHQLSRSTVLLSWWWWRCDGIPVFRMSNMQRLSEWKPLSGSHRQNPNYFVSTAAFIKIGNTVRNVICNTNSQETTWTIYIVLLDKRYNPLLGYRPVTRGVRTNPPFREPPPNITNPPLRPQYFQQYIWHRIPNRPPNVQCIY